MPPVIVFIQHLITHESNKRAVPEYNYNVTHQQVVVIHLNKETILFCDKQHTNDLSLL